ncbi:YkgJ family cysteine cluster protein [Neomoorella mulderi]|uniref:Flagellin N-methylase n=1 Tax=Moorella mulderi DSM 14980 TaxID=1122241 RepID=A0A151AZP8_9FIRM|nr:YkgJ family cysteine cluster protein [Moorella mulderi]KYH33121.1 flagellin N-methylase [Moorella mulderi DSM 14980]
MLARQEQNPVQVRYWQVNGKQGYDLRVLSPEASIADYITAVEGLDPSLLYRPYTNGDCLGCDHCCGGRLPLTSIDLHVLQQGLEELTGKRFSLPEMLEEYCQVQVKGRAVDITLRTDAEGYCIFLEPYRRRCRLYKYRPLICRTYFCCPLTRRARVLRETLVNRGEDELVRYWLSWQPAVPAGVRRHDWPPTPFAGCLSFAEVPLKSLCSLELWRQLRQ